ncbi:MAG: 30S ribosomal protein S4 [Nanoarchaeota archaeon]|nr:30S ribosomal protein S4 [Nanoarchaeota archaeon]
MGSPKKQRKKFSKPSHPWQKERILAEKEILQGYGLRRKYEIWKMGTILKNFTRQAKNLITLNNPQVEKERNQLLTKLSSLGLLGKDAKIEDVLSLTLKDVLERRLQTLVYRKNMAGSLKQARQFIVHDHISLGERTITAPSYLVPLDEEGHIQFSQGSVVADPSHPIRVVAKVEKKDKKEKKEVKEEEKKTKVEGKKAEKGNKTASEKKSEVRKEIKGKKAEVKED